MAEPIDPRRMLEALAPEARTRVEEAFKKLVEEELAAARAPNHDKTHDRVRQTRQLEQ